MPKGVFTSAVVSIYDDLPEVRCQFPQTYLNIAKDLVGDWITYYEPRHGHGRQSNFATARVTHIEPHNTITNNYYLYVSDYLEFPNPVFFRQDDYFFESALRNADGSTNLGKFQRTLREISDHEYMHILQAGFGVEKDKLKDDGTADEPESDYNR